MSDDVAPEQLEDWAEKLRQAFSGNEADREAVVVGVDGLNRYRTEELWREVAYLGYHMHWELGTLLDLEHRDRRMLVRQVAELNERAWEEVRSHAR